MTPLALAVAAYRDAALTSGRLCAALVGDLSAFLNSTDAHAEVPTSLRQLLRLATCNEAQAAVSTLGRSLTDGLASGVAAAVQAPSGGRALLENALDAASTEQGRSLLACVVSAAARQAVAVALEASERTAAHAPGPDSDTLDRVLGELDTDRGRRVAQGASKQAPPLSWGVACTPVSEFKNTARRACDAVLSAALHERPTDTLPCFPWRPL